ncbi:MAG: heavy-metal-associated domain-containing protein [Ilumatobacteraceae bacterium]|jgi:copper ion binding protein
MANIEYTVKGMTCGHCAAAVTDEVSKISGVRDVTVEVAAGRMVVDADAMVTDDLIREAVEEAGYEFVGR